MLEFMTAIALVEPGCVASDGKPVFDVGPDRFE